MNQAVRTRRQGCCVRKGDQHHVLRGCLNQANKNFRASTVGFPCRHSAVIFWSAGNTIHGFIRQWKVCTWAKSKKTNRNCSEATHLLNATCVLILYLSKWNKASTKLVNFCFWPELLSHSRTLLLHIYTQIAFNKCVASEQFLLVFYFWPMHIPSTAE